MHRKNVVFPLCCLLILVCTFPLPARAQSDRYEVGLARIDITPAYPIRLNGYGGRTTASEGVTQRLFAKAIALGSDRQGPAVLITVDSTGVGDDCHNALAARLAKKGITADKLSISSSHAHTTPLVLNICPNIFGADVTPDQAKAIERYTAEMLDKLETVALAALEDRKPARLAVGRGSATFGKNRRPQRGPSDNDVAVMTISDAKNGELRAVLANYASHCTTLGGDFNQLCGDWAGYAQEFIERDHPGVQAMITIGCGADQDPYPRTGLEFAKQNGQSLTTAANEALRKQMTPVTGQFTCRSKRISLPFDTHPTRAEWEQRAKSPDHWVAYHAKKNLARLDRGEKLQTQLPYFMQTWTFGDSLAMVFLPGEVVVEYVLRLKSEYDPARLWVTAYANAVPCYIPSKRIWKEGGYEGGLAMIYFDRPTRLVEGTEDLIFDVLHQIIPKDFVSKR